MTSYDVVMLNPDTGIYDDLCLVTNTAETPREGEHLYLASGAVLPTSGQANPTLTILALAFRLCDRLKAELAG